MSIQDDQNKIAQDIKQLNSDFAQLIADQNPATTTPILPKVSPKAIYPSHKSALVVCPEYPGVVDWRVCPVQDTECKYSGGIAPAGDSAIQVNGIPDTGNTYVLEGVDSLGPYKDPMMSPPSGTMVSINGHGPSTNNPKTICRSDPFTLKPNNNVLSGEVLWRLNPETFDTLKTITPNVQVQDVTYEVQQNSQLRVEQHGTWIEYTDLFVDHRHLMTNVRAGMKTAPDTANASIIMIPVDSSGNKIAANLSTGKTMHVTGMWVPHVNDRQWAELLFFRPTDNIINGGKFDSNDGGNNRPTDGDGFAIRYKPTIIHMLHVFQNGEHIYADPLDESYFNQYSHVYSLARCTWDAAKYAQDSKGNLYSNGFDTNHDQQHRFDFYISKSGYRFVESDLTGKIWIDKSNPWPQGTPIPDHLCVGFRHAVYHPILNLQELHDSNHEVLWKYKLSNGIMTDMQHWGDMAVTLE